MNKLEWLKQIEQVIAQGPFSASMRSLTSYRVPDWYADGKFGIFIHWGPYCVPAFGNEWYPRLTYQPGSKYFDHHVKSYGPHKRFGYKDFIPLFKAEQFDPEDWAALFEASGARFVVPVAEHHDGRRDGGGAKGGDHCGNGNHLHLAFPSLLDNGEQAGAGIHAGPPANYPLGFTAVTT